MHSHAGADSISAQSTQAVQFNSKCVENRAEMDFAPTVITGINVVRSEK
jgi:hypothetical protein